MTIVDSFAIATFRLSEGHGGLCQVQEKPVFLPICVVASGMLILDDRFMFGHLEHCAS